MVWFSPDGSGCFTGISRDAEICPGFPQPQTALVVATSSKKGLWVITVGGGQCSIIIRVLWW